MSGRTGSEDPQALCLLAPESPSKMMHFRSVSALTALTRGNYKRNASRRFKIGQTEQTAGNDKTGQSRQREERIARFEGGRARRITANAAESEECRYDQTGNS